MNLHVFLWHMTFGTTGLYVGCIDHKYWKEKYWMEGMTNIQMIIIILLKCVSCTFKQKL